MKKLLVVVLCMMLVVSFNPIYAVNRSGSVFEVKGNRLKKYDSDVWQLLKYTNEIRLKRGLLPLSINEKLFKACAIRAKETSKRYSHTRPNGTACYTVLKTYKVKCPYAGENIAAVSSDVYKPKQVVDDWMTSPAHRSNIVSKNYQHLGANYYKKIPTNSMYEKYKNTYSKKTFYEMYSSTYWQEMFVGGCRITKIDLQKGNTIVLKKGKTINQANLIARVYCANHGYTYLPVTNRMVKGYSVKSNKKQRVSVYYGKVRKVFTIKRK